MTPAQRRLLAVMPEGAWMTLHELARALGRSSLYGIGQTCGALIALGRLERRDSNGPRYRKVSA